MAQTAEHKRKKGMNEGKPTKKIEAEKAITRVMAYRIKRPGNLNNGRVPYHVIPLKFENNSRHLDYEELVFLLRGA